MHREYTYFRTLILLLLLIVVLAVIIGVILKQYPTAGIYLSATGTITTILMIIFIALQTEATRKSVEEIRKDRLMPVMKKVIGALGITKKLIIENKNNLNEGNYSIYLISPTVSTTAPTKILKDTLLTMGEDYIATVKANDLLKEYGVDIDNYNREIVNLMSILREIESVLLSDKILQIKLLKILKKWELKTNITAPKLETIINNFSKHDFNRKWTSGTPYEKYLELWRELKDFFNKYSEENEELRKLLKKRQKYVGRIMEHSDELIEKIGKIVEDISRDVL